MATEHVILFAGPVGAGKTTAIGTLSEIPVVSTEALNTDLAVSTKLTTTVALDYGQITLDLGHVIRLYGMPGQDRFEFVWKMLQTRAAGLVLLIDASGGNPVASLDFFLDRFKDIFRHGAAVIGITRSDVSAGAVPAQIRARLRERYQRTPVFEVDARDRVQMVVLLTALITLVQMSETELEAS